MWPNYWKQISLFLRQLSVFIQKEGNRLFPFNKRNQFSLVSLPGT
jgi:hypothetical protein